MRLREEASKPDIAITAAQRLCAVSRHKEMCEGAAAAVTPLSAFFPVLSLCLREGSIHICIKGYIDKIAEYKFMTANTFCVPDKGSILSERPRRPPPI